MMLFQTLYNVYEDTPLQNHNISMLDELQKIENWSAIL